MPRLLCSDPLAIYGVVNLEKDDGNDTNPGTSILPKASIQAAIATADSAYTIGVVYVAEGTYNVNYQNVTHVVMAEGISVYGGYKSDDWSMRDFAAYPSIITDISSAAGTDVDPARAVDFGTGKTAATTLDGFTINASITSFNLSKTKFSKYI